MVIKFQRKEWLIKMIDPHQNSFFSPFKLSLMPLFLFMYSATSVSSYSKYLG